MTPSPIEDLRRHLQDSEYARAFGGEVAKSAFAATFASARRAANLSQKELADRIGASQAYVAKLESGEANPTLDKVGRVLAALGLRLVMNTEPLAPPVSAKRDVLTLGFGNATADAAQTQWTRARDYPLTAPERDRVVLEDRPSWPTAAEDTV